MYYFNDKTGATTWDIKDIVSSADLPSSGRQLDLGSLSVEELERMLRRKKQEEDLSPSKHKRKLDEKPNSNSKRKRIVLNFSTEDEEKKKRNTQVTTQSQSVKENCKRLVPNCKSADKSKDKNLEKSHDSDDSLVYDEDELQQLKKIKSKHKSPPKSTLLKKALSSNSSLSKQKSKIGSSLDISPTKLKSQKKQNIVEEMVRSQNILLADSNNPSTSKFLPQNYSNRYVNYQDDEKLTYASKPRVRKEKPVSGHKKRSPAPRAQVKEPVVNPLEVTPDHDVDVTPVYGSFDSPELECGDEATRFNLKQSIHQQQRQAYVPPPPIRPYEPPSFSAGPKDCIDDSGEKSFNDISYEGERPPTPTLVKEIEEEEGMEWEPSEVEQIIKETAKVRDMAMVSGEVESEDHETSEEKIPASKCLVIVDTNILISCLNTVVKLMDHEQVVIVIPWMVVQELDSLKNSDNQKTAVGARGGVRWLNSTLLSSSSKLKTETAAQSRTVAAKFGSKSPDDKILATCFQYKEDGHKVILATNDVNLGNKALINHLLYRDSRNILDLVDKKGELEAAELSFDEDDSNIGVINGAVTLVKDYLRDSLEGVLREEFRSTFGEVWEKIVSIPPKTSKPYWTLSQLFTLYSKHHIAVFGLNFPRNGRDLKDNLEYVKTSISRSKPKTTTEAKILFTEIKKLIECIKVRGDYDGLVSICEEKMLEAMSQLEEIESRKIANPNDLRSISSRVQEQVQSLFQTIWEIVIVFTRGFTVIYQVDCDPPIPLVEPNIQFHSLEQAARELPSFFRSVSGLHDAMIKAVSTGDEASIGQFHDLLLGFRAGLELDQSYWAVQDSTITRRQLCAFMTRPENREMVTNGLDQMSGFRRNLIKCLEGPIDQM